MKKKIVTILFGTVIIAGIMAGCGRSRTEATETENSSISEAGSVENGRETTDGSKREETGLGGTRVTPTEKIRELTDSLSVVHYEGNYGFTEFLEQGGAKDDAAVAQYLMDSISSGGLALLFGGNPFGCSTVSAAGENGSYLFGRNFDWNTCDALIVSAKPEEGYASVSTVNMNFVSASGVELSSLPDNIQAIVALYAPLDGMNEQGLAVSVNMIQDSDSIDQDTEKPDITTTTAIRLLLDRAADVEEAVELLREYDLHASMGMMVHFALADAQGNSVAVEYIGDEMSVVETPVVTNFYLTQGEKYGIGTGQSHERYEILMERLNDQETMTEADVRDALDSVSKDNFGQEFESTEWSIVMNQETKELTYFHRENYEDGYTIAVPAGE